MKNNHIYIITGKKQSGKDTISEIIYNEIKNNSSKSVEIIHFADKLKEILSIILDIPIHFFNNDDLKKNLYIDFNDFSIIDCRHEKKYIPNTAHNLRSILQNTGTYIEPYFGEDIWAKSIVKKTKELLKNSDVIIPDLRRKCELNAIQCNFNKDQYTIIKIIRKKKFKDWLESVGISDSFKDFDIDFLLKKQIESDDIITSNQFVNVLLNSKLYYDPLVNKAIKQICHQTEVELDDFNGDYILYNDSHLENLIYKTKSIYNIINSK